MIKRLLSVIIVLALGCESSTDDCVCPPEMQLSEMYECHMQDQWDPASVRNQLNGKWVWQYSGCPWVNEVIETESMKGRTVEFFGVDGLRIYDGDDILLNTTWQLDANEGSFQVVTNESVDGLAGYLLFCDNNLSFNLSYVDGCDHMYLKNFVEHLE